MTPELGAYVCYVIENSHAMPNITSKEFEYEIRIELSETVLLNQLRL